MKTVSAFDMQRQITKAYLEDAGISLVLKRPVRERTATGGLGTESITELPPQTFALIGPQAGLRRAPEAPADVGSIASYNLTLLGYHDADVLDNDFFELDNGRYRVDFVFPDHYRAQYETVCVVVYEGSHTPPDLSS